MKKLNNFVVSLLTCIGMGYYSVDVHAACASGNCGDDGPTYKRPTYNPSANGAYINPYVYRKGVDERAYSQEARTGNPALPYSYMSTRPSYSYSSEPCDPKWVRNIGIDIKRDFVSYFQPCNLLFLTGAMALSAVSANTSFDRSVSNYWQDDIKSSDSNRFFKPFNDIGGLSYYYFPIYLAAVGLGAWQDCTLTGNVVYHWGYRSLRTIVLTTVQQIPLTYLIGSGRPSRHEPSKWQPFKYKTGISGHTIFGAVPFLTAAMMTDAPLLRYSLYALSTLPGLARINNNSHYLSQVALGWSIAYLSARAVYHSDQMRQDGVQVSLVPKYDGALLLARYEF